MPSLQFCSAAIARVILGCRCRVLHICCITLQNDYVDAKNRTFLEQWQQPPAGSAVRYVGSTTGTSYDDEAH